MTIINNTASVEVTRLIIERSLSENGPFMIVEETVASSTINFSNNQLMPGTTYYYKIGHATQFGHTTYLEIIPVTTSDNTEILFVDVDATGANNGTSWTNAFTDLTDAMMVLDLGDEVWVAAGTYIADPSEGGFLFGSEYAQLLGGFGGTETSSEERDPASNVTILSGDSGVLNDPSDNVGNVLVVDSGVENTVDGFTIRDGNGSSNGAGISISSTNVTINNCIITQNTGQNGGGIYQTGTGHLTITNSTISNNTSLAGAGIYAEPDGVFTTELVNVTVSGNTGNTSGGGIYFNSDYGELKISESDISDNHFLVQEDGDGGGLYVQTGQLSIEQSTINNNSANNHGGGIYVIDLFSVRIENTQIDGNEAGLQNTGARGGGIYIDNFSFDESPFVMINSTVSNNTTPNNGGGLFSQSKEHAIVNSTFSGNMTTMGNGGAIAFNTGELLATLNHVTITNNSADRGGGGIFNSGGSLTVTNVMLAGNTHTDSPDFSGTLTSGGYNVIGDLGLSTFDSNTTSDKYGDTQDNTTENAGAEEFAAAINPLLDDLAANFGETKTHALLEGSPAIDMGTTLDFEGETIMSDQRGFAYEGGAPDIGAYELTANKAPTLQTGVDLALTSINEDDTDPNGNLIQNTFSELDIADIDGPGTGIAVVDVDNGSGTWEYSINNGSDWVGFDSPSIATARLLAVDGSTRVRFIPTANFNGAINPGLTFYAWDQSAGAVGGTLDATNRGGITPFSLESETISITVLSVNDIPTIINPLIDQETTVGELFEFDIPDNTFADVDAGDVLTLSATQPDDTALPTWLSFNSFTQTLSGTPSPDESGILTIKVTASDQNEALVIDEFNITVIPKTPVVNGIGEELTSQVLIYPNPSGEWLGVRTENNIEGSMSLRIINLSGQVLRNDILQKNDSHSVHIINLSGLKAGTYIY